MDAFLAPYPRKLLCGPCFYLQGSSQTGPFSFLKFPASASGSAMERNRREEKEHCHLVAILRNCRCLQEEGGHSESEVLLLFSSRAWLCSTSGCVGTGVLAPMFPPSCFQLTTHRVLSFWNPQALSCFTASSAFSS